MTTPATPTTSARAPDFGHSRYAHTGNNLYDIGVRDGTATGITLGWNTAIAVLLDASGAAFRDGRDDEARTLRDAARRIQAATPPKARARAPESYEQAWKTLRELWEAAGCPEAPVLRR